LTRFSDLPLIITVKPSPARVEAMARPMPAVEPVTSARLPDSCKSMMAPLTATALCRTSDADSHLTAPRAYPQRPAEPVRHPLLRVQAPKRSHQGPPR